MLTGKQAFERGYLENGLPELIQPASIDVRLGPYFRTYTTTDKTGFKWGPDVVDPSKDEPETYLTYVSPGEALYMAPGELVLASTVEVVNLDGRASGSFEGKSSLGRLGLGTHVTAGFIDPGFHGEITIELSNVSDFELMLWPGMKIGQICFYEMDEEAELYGEAFGSTYQNQSGPVPYRISKSFMKKHPNEVTK